MAGKKLVAFKKNFGIILHFLKLAHEIDKMYISTLLLSSVFRALTPLINIIMPKFIIDELIGEQRAEVFVLLVGITIVGNFILNLINRWLSANIAIKNERIIYGFDAIIGKKIMDLDFENIEDLEVLNLKEQAIYPLKNQGVLWRMINGIINMLSQCITLVALMSIIANLNLLLIVFLIAIVLFNSSIMKKSQAMQYKFYEELIPINRKFGYYGDLTSDFSMGKDVRLYNMSPLLMEKIKKLSTESADAMGKMFIMGGKYEGLRLVNIQLQMMGIYGYIAYKVYKKAINIGDFALYTNAAINFSTTVSNLFNTYVELTQMCRYLEAFIKLQSMETVKKSGTKKIKSIEKINVEFRNVSFKYPRAENYTLNNINITINDGEKLSVVGLNGAGKTTFIKLLARLYTPTKGEILLNGTNINEYDHDDYMSLLSVVFQDYKLLAFSIKENVALNNYNYQEDSKVENILTKAGFNGDLSKLENGIYTSIYKSFDKKGIEFSGGQSQKLALARAIYKDAPIVILDEPTAALDPFAEFEVYSKFNELIGPKTAIYISHRLSSCKFCDKIAVFHRGELTQYGTHEELMYEKDKEYYEMYSMQAQYYV